MRSWTRPTVDTVKQALGMLIDVQHVRYFFERLNNPQWIEPLTDLGAFARPPDPVRNLARNTISFPPWPESLYLVRVAAAAPSDAVRGILSIPRSENVAVLDDRIAVALAVSPTLSSKLVPSILENYESDFGPLRCGESLGELAVHLASGGETARALDVVAAVLALEKTSGEASKRTSWHLDRKHSRIEAWGYGQILLKYVVQTAPTIGMPLLSMISKTLVDASGSGPELHDNSDYWLDSLNDLEPDSRTSHALVKALLEAARSLLLSGGVELIDEVCRVLTVGGGSVGLRIAFHLLSMFPTASPGLVNALIEDRSLFDLREVRLEYQNLLELTYHQLPQKTQRDILQWIEDGPQISVWRENHRAFMGSDLSDSELQSRLAQWRFDFLYALRTHLPEDLCREFETLKSEHGPLPTFMRPRTSRAGMVGESSPHDAARLAFMNDEQLLQFLHTWEAPSDRGEPSKAGLGIELAVCVERDPQRFSSLAPSFKGMNADYVGGVFEGLQRALKAERTFEWSPVLELALWTVRNRLPSQQDANQGGRPREWRSTHLSIARIVRDAISGSSDRIGVEHKSHLWSLLEALLSDPDPAPETEDETVERASNRALNCVRGVAMDAAIHYALWLRKHLPSGGRDVDMLDEIPTVFSALDGHLDIRREPSLAVRSVYGRLTPWINMMSPRWFSGSLSKIFPRSVEERSFRAAAWTAYLCFCPPYDDTFVATRPEYERSVGELPTDLRDDLGSAGQFLGEHLLYFYLRGKVLAEEPLHSTFWERAPPDVRRHVVLTAARILEEPNLPATAIGRLIALWESRRSTAEGASDRAPYTGEMMAFGIWFQSKLLPLPWVVSELKRACQISLNIDRPLEVVRRLLAVAQDYPSDAMHILELIAQGDEWGILSRSREVPSLVRKCLELNPAGTKEVVDRLARDLGWLDLMAIVRA